MVIVTAGEDEIIKFWDTELNLISEWPIKMSGMTSMDETRNFSVQSLDIYACEPNTNMAGTKASNTISSGEQRSVNPTNRNPYMLVGTRSGYVFEVILTTEFRGLKNSDEDGDLNNNSFENEEDLGLNGGKGNVELKKIEFHPNIIFRYHSTQDTTKFKENAGIMKMIYISHHPTREVFVSIGNDNA